MRRGRLEGSEFAVCRRRRRLPPHNVVCLTTPHTPLSLAFNKVFSVIPSFNYVVCLLV